MTDPSLNIRPLLESIDRAMAAHGGSEVLRRLEEEPPWLVDLDEAEREIAVRLMEILRRFTKEAARCRTLDA
jgi:hypothetical protein